MAKRVAKSKRKTQTQQWLYVELQPEGRLFIYSSDQQHPGFEEKTLADLAEQCSVGARTKLRLPLS